MRTLSLSVVLSLLTASACFPTQDTTTNVQGSVTNHGGGGTGGGSSTGGSAASTSGGASGGTGSSGGVGGDGGSQPYAGVVQFLDYSGWGELALPGAQPSQAVQASFLAPEVVPYCSVSPSVQMGNCCFDAYTSGIGADVLPGVVGGLAANAGTLTYTDDGGVLGTEAFSGSGYPQLSPQTFGVSLWSPGDTLGASAAGSPSGVDAFAASVVAPQRFTGLTPSITYGKSYPISANLDFVVQWTPSGGSGTVAGTLLQDLSGNFPNLVCSASDGDGTLTFPSPLLQMFSPDGGMTLVLTRTDTGTFTGQPANAAVNVVAQTQLIAGITFQ